jgi:hypothetical protein
MKSLLIAIPVCLIASPAFSQDLNAQLASHLCNAQWTQAIADIDKMISIAPSYRGQLVSYRSRLLALQQSNYSEGFGCSSPQSVSPPPPPPEQYRPVYVPPSSEVRVDSTELGRQTDGLLNP